MRNKWKRGLCLALAATVVGTGCMTGNYAGQTAFAAEGNGTARQVEALDRGVTAIKVSNGVYLSWRYKGTDTENTTFEIYRNGEKITGSPIGDSTNYTDTVGTTDSVYRIHTLVDGVETEVSEEVFVLANDYFDIPLDVPQGGITPKEEEYTYFPGDASCGDLDGDGEYEIILKWDPSNAKDNSKTGYTGNVYIDAYKLDGTRLWRIDLGVNIRAGAHYTQFMVYDLDGDGYSEMVCKTADGTIDGLGHVIGDGDADWRNSAGTILKGPEYLTLFDGLTGKALDTIDYVPERGDVNDWGDDYGNRSERYLAGVAYLNGKTPSVIMCRGYYTRSVLVAYDVVDKKLKQRWIFDSDKKGNEDYYGQGNHNLAVGDADGDGYDEIVYGACTIDHDGTGLYSNKYGHGDALHLGDFVPEDEGLEIWSCCENSPYGAALRDAATGKEYFRKTAGSDTGRCVAGNFVAGNGGAEYAYVGSSMFDETGAEIGSWFTKWNNNFVVYWDGNLEHEAMDRTMIDSPSAGRVYTAPGVDYINDSKSNCCLSADILGDWREEVIWPTSDGANLRVCMTTYPTEYRIATLMHDTQYRCQVASQNVGYNQPPHTSFFLGTGYELPEQPDVQEVSARDEEQEKGLIAYFTMNDEAGLAGGGAVASVMGTVAFENDSERGKVLSLSGTGEGYLKVTKEDGSSLLSGLSEMTVSFYSKAGRPETNWPFYAAPWEDTQTYLNEYYLGILEYSGNIVAERYANGREESQSIEGVGNGGWNHVVLVAAEDETRLYINGVLAVTEENPTALGSILGSAGIVQIGKANWGTGEYYGGLLDEFKIYNYALSEDEVQKEYGVKNPEENTEENTEESTEGNTEGNTEGSTEGSTEESTEGNTEESTEGNTEESTEGNTEESTEGSTEESTEGNTEESTEGNTEESTEGNTEESTEGNTEESTEGNTEESTEGNTEGSTEGNTEESTEGNTEGSTEGSTEESTEGNTEGSTEGNIGGSTGGSTGENTAGNTGENKNENSTVNPGDSTQTNPGTGGTNGETGAPGTSGAGQNADSEAKKQAQAGTIALEESEKAIITTNTDKGDVAGSRFGELKLKAVEGNRHVKLSWSKIKTVDGYIIYGAPCGKPMKLIKEVSASAKSHKVTGLAKGKYYKYMVVAYRNIYGEKRAVSASKTVHICTQNGKNGNPTAVVHKKNKVTLKKGKTYTLKPKLKYKKKIKVHIAKFRYESSDSAIVTVSKNGKIKGKKKGTCYIYMYTQNGLYKRVKVTVKNRQ